MTLLIIKLCLTPLLIALVTLAGRRWGAGPSGLLAGLPLTSGPVSVFFALEQGHEFAASAAAGSIAGIAGVGAFCLAYAVPATKRYSWPACFAIGLLAYTLVIGLLQPLALPLLPTCMGAVAWSAFIIAAFPSRPETESSRKEPVRGDVLLRMAAATTFVLALTAAASALGSRLSGLLTPFPVFAAVLAVFTHRRQGAPAASRLLRGIVLGSFAFIAFFVVAGVLLPRLHLFWTYLAACAGALGVSGVTCRFS